MIEFLARLDATPSKQVKSSKKLSTGVFQIKSPDEDDVIEESEEDEQEEEEDEEDLQLDLSNTKMNPYRLWKMLERLGYKKTNFQQNGWEFDFWIYFEKPGSRKLMVWGTGITFNLWLTKAGTY